MKASPLISDPASLPLREIHLPESIGWWPPAPGWWILPAVVLLGAAVAWYSGLLYKRRRYSAINMARKELVEIKSRYVADRDASRCVRAVSGLLRRLCISVFPRNETAGLAGAEWLVFLQERVKTEDKVRKSPDGEKNKGDEGLQNIGRVLLEAPYRQRVAEEEVESLIGFCSDWIDTVAGISHRARRNP